MHSIENSVAFRWIIIGRSGIKKEADHGRGGKKENCRCATGEMGQAQAGKSLGLR